MELFRYKTFQRADTLTEKKKLFSGNYVYSGINGRNKAGNLFFGVLVLGNIAMGGV
jgi:hypothetical protein